MGVGWIVCYFRSHKKNKRDYERNSLRFSGEVTQKGKTQTAPSLQKMCYELIDSTEEGQPVVAIKMEQKANNVAQYELSAAPYKLVRNPGRAWDIGAPTRFYGFPDEVTAYYKNAAFVKEIALSHENLFGQLYYLGPLRQQANRLYNWVGNEPDSVGPRGEYTISAYLSASKRKISGGPNKHTHSFDKWIAMKLKEMGLIEKFEVRAITAGRQEYEVRVSTGKDSGYVEIPDVGFGISQVLPVLVQCYYAPKNSIILMEQPEIHLHPAAQSALADIMIEAIQARENGEDRNIQLLIETHSEHFLRRLQRRIAEDSSGALGEKVAGYVARDSGMESLQIDSYGNIRNWPENFFGNTMGDMFEQSRAGMQRRKREMNSEKSEKGDS